MDYRSLFFAGSAGNGVVNAGASIRPEVNRTSSGAPIYLCTAAAPELISKSVSSIMICTYFVYSDNVSLLIPKINSKKLKNRHFSYVIVILTDLGTLPFAGSMCTVLFQDTAY